jgi:hypothetical protein
MNSKLVKLLASVCAVLLLVIFAEWVYAKLAQQELLASTTIAARKKPPVEMPKVELTEQPEEYYDQMVARPLFIKGRRPVDEPKPEDTQALSVATVFDWELTGVYTKNKSLSALFSRSKTKVPKDNYRKIAVDAYLDGWKLVEIHKDRVILMQGGNQKELLLRKPKPKQMSQPKAPVNPAAPVLQPVPTPTPESEPEPEQIPDPEIPPPEFPEEPFENPLDEQQF